MLTGQPELPHERGQRAAKRRVEPGGRISSPRVVPWFTISTGIPSDAACRTYRSPDMTVNDDPSTTTAEDEDTSEKHCSTRGLGTFSPKNTTSGLSRPPHERQSATVNPRVSSSVRARRLTSMGTLNRRYANLANRPDSRRGGLQLLIHLDVSSLGELHADQFQAESFGVRNAAGGDQYMTALEDFLDSILLDGDIHRVAGLARHLLEPRI